MFKFFPSRSQGGSAKKQAKTQLDVLKTRYIQLAKSRKVDGPKAEEDFENICALPEIVTIAIPPDCKRLVVRTTHVYLTRRYSGDEHDIGTFAIVFDREEMKTYFFNQTRTVLKQGVFGHLHHPHVTEAGIICMPEGTVQLRQAIVDGRLLKAVKIALSGLHTLSNSPYGDVTLWPLKEGRDVA